MPGFAALPGWLWRRTSRALRVAIAVVLLAQLRATVLADARRRIRSGELDGRARRAECERYPRTVGGPAPEEDLARGTARLACVAVTAEFGRSDASVGGVIGHPYRAVVDFRTGRTTFCRAIGVTGPEREPLVTIPKACGG